MTGRPCAAAGRTGIAPRASSPLASRRGEFFGSTTTLVPTLTRLNRSATSSLVRRMQPEETNADGRGTLCRECDRRWSRDTSRARPGIAGTARHEARQIGLARDHFRRRMPIRHSALRLMVCTPDQALAADADAVTNGAAPVEHVIERGVAGIDDARRFAGVEAITARRSRSGTTPEHRLHRSAPAGPARP